MASSLRRMIPFDRKRVSKAIRRSMRKHLDRILHGFSWEKVSLTKEEKAIEKRGKMTAARYLRL